MITQDQRREARLVIEELLGVRVRAAKAEADPEAGLAPADAVARRRLGVRARPEIALPSALIRAAGNDGSTWT